MSEELDLGSYMLHVSTVFKNLYACDSAYMNSEYYYYMIYMCMPGPSSNRGARILVPLNVGCLPSPSLRGLKEANKHTLDGSGIPRPTTVWM